VSPPAAWPLLQVDGAAGNPAIVDQLAQAN
jgi:hypothetical protein